MKEILLPPGVDYRAASRAEEFPYRDAIEAAKRWLGAAYLCYQPVNRKPNYAQI